MKLYKFKAIIPNFQEYTYDIQSQRVVNSNQPSLKLVNQRYYPQILEQIKINRFCERQNEHLYALKVKSKNLETLGLVIKFRLEDIREKLYLHEKTIDSKVKGYIKDLSKFNILTSPLILSHNESRVISNYLKVIIDQPKTVEFTCRETSYLLWEINDAEELSEYFIREIDYLFLADGHHRLKALEESNKEFLYAYVISNNQLKSRIILRVYENLPEEKIIGVLETLMARYYLKRETNSCDSIRDSIMAPSFLYKNESFSFHGSLRDTVDMLADIYTLLTPAELNFQNRKDIRELKGKEENLCLFIPKLKPSMIVQNNLPKLSPHSSYFDPKIPDGFLSMLL